MLEIFFIPSQCLEITTCLWHVSRRHGSNCYSIRRAVTMFKGPFIIPADGRQTLVGPQPRISFPVDDSVSSYLEPQSDFPLHLLTDLHGEIYILFHSCTVLLGQGLFREQNKWQRAAMEKRAEKSLCSESRECCLAETTSCTGLERMHASRKDVVGLPPWPSQAENG